MPYIKSIERPQYDDQLDNITQIYTKGQLEYCAAKLLCIYMHDKEKNYNNWHNGIYALKHVADEYRRRFLDKREDKARKKNGDIKCNHTK
jgi:hypothetical protein